MKLSMSPVSRRFILLDLLFPWKRESGLFDRLLDTRFHGYDVIMGRKEFFNSLCRSDPTHAGSFLRSFSFLPETPESQCCSACNFDIPLLLL
jgi:hypothetical protein